MLRVVFPYIEVGLTVEVPSDAVWDILVDTARWPEWGPTVRAVACPDRFLTPRSRGRIRTVLGFSVPFVVLRFEPGKAWSWSINGIPATTHTVERLGPRRSRLFFGVPIPAFPYLAVCLVAIWRIAALVSKEKEPA